MCKLMDEVFGQVYARCLEKPFGFIIHNLWKGNRMWFSYVFHTNITPKSTDQGQR